MSVKLGESSLVKRPYTKTKFTKHQLDEFMKCIDPVTGPHYFMSNYFYVQHPTKGKMLFRPFGYQIRMIESYHRDRRIVAMMPRQCGKTVTAAGYLLWAAMFNNDMNILIAAHKFSGASEIMDRIKFGYESVPDFIRAGITEYNKQSMVFDNGSKILAQTTTPSTGRGKSVSILYIDELAFVRPTITSEFWASCSMTLSTGGKVIVTSTPNNPDDLFAGIWRDANKRQDESGNTIANGLGTNGFKAVTASWDEHPDRDEQWANEQKEIIGLEMFSREVLLQFITFDEVLIDPFVLNDLNGIEPIEKQGIVRWYGKPKKGHTYILALDPSLGTGGDPAAIQVVEANTHKQIGEWVHNKTPVEAQIKLLKEMAEYVVSITNEPAKIYWSVENNTIGEAALVTIRNIGEESIPGMFLSEPAKMGTARKYRKGFTTTNSNKLAACAKLKSLIETKKMTLYSKKLITELRSFISVDNTYRAKTGETDDLVLALILVVRMLEVLKNYVPELSDPIDVYSQSVPLPFVMSSYW